MRMIMVRVVAVFFALTWLIFPGFGLIDLSVTWDPEWPVVLEASWGVFMTVLVGGAFLAIAALPQRAAPPAAALAVALVAMTVSVVAGLEWPLLLYVALLVGEGAVVAAMLRRPPDREPVWPRAWFVRWPLLVIAALAVVPWLVHAVRMYRSNRRDAGVIIGDVTMGVDHYAVQGALALALAALALLAAVWPRGRRYLGICVGLCAGYLGVVSWAFPGTWAGFSDLWSALCVAWGLAVLVFAVVGRRSERGELGLQVVEAERAL